MTNRPKGNQLNEDHRYFCMLNASLPNCFAMSEYSNTKNAAFCKANFRHEYRYKNFET